MNQAPVTEATAHWVKTRYLEMNENLLWLDDALVGIGKKYGLVIHQVLQKRLGTEEMVDYGPISLSRDAVTESLVFQQHHTSLPVNLLLLLLALYIHRDTGLKIQ